MLVEFSTLAPTDRIWIYASPNPFSEEVQALVLKDIQAFIHQWSSHQIDLHAAIDIRENQFICIGVKGEVKEASGCSIDKSVALIQSLEKSYAIKLLDRTFLYFKKDNKVLTVPLSQLKSEILSGNISEETQFFDTTLTSKEALDNLWLQPASATWIKRYFTPVSS